jgi:hypothetical protein
MLENRSMLPENSTGCARFVRMEEHARCGS